MGGSVNGRVKHFPCIEGFIRYLWWDPTSEYRGYQAMTGEAHDHVPATPPTSAEGGGPQQQQQQNQSQS